MRSRWARLPAAAIVVLPVMLAGCGGDDQAGDAASAGNGAAASGMRVVATHPILGDIAGNVVGDDAALEVVIPAGADPHEFQPSAKDVETIIEADVVVANGADFETGLLDALDAAAADGVIVFEVASAFPDGTDPHVWFDPPRMASAVEALGEELAALDPAGDWAERAGEYAAEIRTVDGEVERILSAVPPERRTLVTNHEALGYFAARYGFDVAGAAIPSLSTAAESSAADLAALADTLATHDVPVVFADVSAPDDLAQALAAESGTDVQVVPLLTETLAEQGDAGDDYLGLLRLVAQRIADALG
jgi:zinc/manganese transport system substrate-binding protein